MYIIKKMVSMASVVLLFWGSAANAEIFNFPLTGTDTITVQTDPWWWNIGDNAEGTRSISHNTQSGELRLSIENGLDNTCSPGNWVDLDLSINGIVVGTHRVIVGDTEAIIPFNLITPVSGTTTIKVEETNQVCSGAGSIKVDTSGVSKIEFFDKTIAVPLSDSAKALLAILFAFASFFMIQRRRIV